MNLNLDNSFPKSHVQLPFFQMSVELTNNQKSITTKSELLN